MYNFCLLPVPKINMRLYIELVRGITNGNLHPPAYSFKAAFPTFVPHIIIGDGGKIKICPTP